MKAASTQEDVADLMTTTFTARRAVVLESATIAEIHEDFTPLFQRTEVRPIQMDSFIIKSELRSRPIFSYRFSDLSEPEVTRTELGGKLLVP